MGSGAICSCLQTFILCFIDHISYISYCLHPSLFRRVVILLPLASYVALPRDLPYRGRRYLPHAIFLLPGHSPQAPAFSLLPTPSALSRTQAGTDARTSWAWRFARTATMYLRRPSSARCFLTFGFCLISLLTPLFAAQRSVAFWRVLVRYDEGRWRTATLRWRTPCARRDRHAN